MEFAISDNQVFHRYLAVGFRGMTNNYENGYDGEMFDRKPTDVALQTDDWTSPMVITSIQDFNEDIEIPITVYLDKTRDLTFTLDGLENLTTPVYLKDAVTNQYYNLTDANATLTLDAGTYSDRFFVTFKQGTLGVEDNEMIGKITSYYDKVQNKIRIKTTSDISLYSVAVYNLLGQKIGVFPNIKEEKEFSIDVKNDAKTVYILKIKTNKGVVSKKIVLIK